MQDNLCFACGGKGYMAYPHGKVLAYKDLSVLADLHKIKPCPDCNGTGLRADKSVWLLVICIVSIVIVISFLLKGF
jgi:hypothetical protein